MPSQLNEKMFDVASTVFIFCQCGRINLLSYVAVFKTVFLVNQIIELLNPGWF